MCMLSSPDNSFPTSPSQDLPSQLFSNACVSHMAVNMVCNGITFRQSYGESSVAALLACCVASITPKLQLSTLRCGKSNVTLIAGTSKLQVSRDH